MRPSLTRKILSHSLAVAAIALPATLLAQTPAPTPTPPPLWSGKGELSFVATSGNSDTQTIGTAAEVEYRPGVWAVLFKSAFVRSEADGEEKARSLTATLRGSRLLSPRLEVFARGDYLKNPSAGIDDRLSVEGGVACAILPNPPNKLKAEAGLGYTKENRVMGEAPAFASTRAGLLYEWRISKSAAYKEELSFTQNLESGSDWLIVNTGSLSADVSTVLALKLSFGITYDNEPVPGFKKRDTTTSAAVVAKF